MLRINIPRRNHPRALTSYSNSFLQISDFLDSYYQKKNKGPPAICITKASHYLLPGCTRIVCPCSTSKSNQRIISNASSINLLWINPHNLNCFFPHLFNGKTELVRRTRVLWSEFIKTKSLFTGQNASVLISDGPGPSSPLFNWHCIPVCFNKHN